MAKLIKRWFGVVSFYLGNNQKFSLILFGLTLVWLIGAQAGCSWLTGSKQVENPEELAAKGMECFAKEDYDDALKAFNTLKERYPYSRYAILAELKVADAHFCRKAYPEAIAAYEDFVQLHPKNEAVPYVLYQIPVCYYEQILSEDRDQTPTRMAIRSFLRLVREYPDCAYSSKASKKIEECRELLVRHELYIARFYFKSKHYEAALCRFEGVLSGYNDVLSSKTEKEVKKGIVACEERLSEEAQE